MALSDGADHGCASGDHGACSPTFCLVARDAESGSCFESAGGCDGEATVSGDESDSSCGLGCVTGGASRSVSDDHGCRVALGYGTVDVDCGISFGDCVTGVAEGWENGAAVGWDCDAAGSGYVVEGWGFDGADLDFDDADSGYVDADSGYDDADSDYGDADLDYDDADSGYVGADSGYDDADSGYDDAGSGYDVVG